MKRFILGLTLLASLQLISAQPQEKGALTRGASVTTIDIEPEQCVTRCFYIGRVRIFCYTSCF